MAADINDKFTEATNGTRPVPTTLTSLKAIGAASISCGALTGWPTATAVHFIIYTTDVNGNKVAGSQTDWKGIVSGTSITQLVLKAGTDNGYAVGAVVEAAPTAAWADDVTEGIMVEHNQDGTHSDITADSIDVSGDITSGGTITADEFIVSGAGSDQGWETGLPAPDTVTYNGNRSYDLVFNSTDLTDTVSPGMRLRATRTVTASIQCADLESGSSHYFNKTTPAGTTFTDDFCAGAWIKLESFGTAMTILSRWNGTSGWTLDITSVGRLQLVGFNGGSSNNSYVLSTKTIPLGKWIHVAAQLDMSAFTATSTTSYIMFDGVDVPATVVRGGTNPTALIQAGNLEVGSRNGGLQPFDGKLSNVFYSSAKITQANMRLLQGQDFTAALCTTHSIVSAFTLNNTLNDVNTTNANNLTAQNSAVATNADSPFALGSGLASAFTDGTTEFMVATAATFSTNTTITVQLPEGCALPTSGGISAVFYSSLGSPYGFPKNSGKWDIESLSKDVTVLTSGNRVPGLDTAIPVGAWRVHAQACASVNRTSGGAVNCQFGISTSTSTISEQPSIAFDYGQASAQPYGCGIPPTKPIPLVLSAATTYYGTVVGVFTGADLQGGGFGTEMHRMVAEFDYL